MKKRLYFWNDLEIFFPEKKTELELVDKRMQEFFEVISKEGNVIYRYLSLQETRIWCKKIKFYIDTPCIFLGTRPNMIFTNKNVNSITLYPKRKRSVDGKTKVVILSEKEKELVRAYVRREKKIHIIEDILVCGVTMKELLKEINGSSSVTQDVIIELFAENVKSALEMKKEFGQRIYIECFCEMQGECISESTCICAYDILNGKFKEMEQDESIEKLRYFFGQYTPEIIEGMKHIKNMLVDY